MGVNVSALFICDSEGTIIDRFRAGLIRKTTGSLFELYAKLKVAPLKWGTASHKVIMHFNYHMVKTYGELAFCHDNWKAQFFATALYPGWQKTNIAPTVAVKKEKVEGELDSNSKAAGKRQAPEMEGDSDGTASSTDFVQPPAKKKKMRRRPKLMVSDEFCFRSLLLTFRPRFKSILCKFNFMQKITWPLNFK